MTIVERTRENCAAVARQATNVQINEDVIAAYAAQLTKPGPEELDRAGLTTQERERAAAYWLTLNAVNFGSGWFPTLKKLAGMTGFRTIQAGIDRRFRDDGPWPAAKLRRITAAEISTLMGQEPDHPLMPLFKTSLQDLGTRIETAYDGSFTELVASAEGSAVNLVEQLAGWDCFADFSDYGGLQIPFLKRAQIAANDLGRAGVASWKDADQLTLFADNLVPHVLRIDGVLTFEPSFLDRVNAGVLIEHNSEPEIEMRACAVHAVELISAHCDLTAAELDTLLWNRGQGPQYKALPRPRSRCTAY